MKRATRESYGATLVELGKEREDIVVLEADLSKATKSEMFAKEFPERFVNVGIAEQNMVGMAAGLASTGKVTFATTFAVFAAGRAFEVIRNSVCYPKANVKIAATHAGITVGPDGGSHQAIEDIAIMCSLPNMVVLSPADDIEACKCVKAAAEIDAPVYLRFGRIALDDIYTDEYNFKIGKGNEIFSGNDVTIISTGIMVHKSLKAAKELKEEGINARVINMATIKPIDEEIIIKAAKETKGIVTVEEHSVIGGLGDRVSAVVCENAPIVVKKIGVKDVFGESGSPDALLEKHGLTVENIKETVKNIVR
ncbi:MAG: transketolase family protein [Terrisporobacter othiniensis]|uniref:transketolase family protein n=1 Tax=Terrisporobacter petrolearius TaxID=1460447 RepID=UPI0008EEDC93|nr:transketolase family protein [Terrisporobacter petrolearius]MDU4862366.1 transketolase family protein [Terrisporobacter othiniensis]MDU6996191.1 transketolase family protein [Terrisporobacter othiniensis]SFJ69328.1 transketolase [Terrisporobacter glycolicus]